MVDLSDGLATDIRHIMDGSGCGFLLYRENIPVSTSLGELKPEAQVYHAMSDGEDFELLFTAPPEERIPDKLGTGTEVHRIGEVIKDRQSFLEKRSNI